MTIMEQAKAILIEMDEIGGENDMPLEPAQQDDADLPQTAPTSPVADQTSSADVSTIAKTQTAAQKWKALLYPNRKPKADTPAEVRFLRSCNLLKQIALNFRS